MNSKQAERKGSKRAAILAEDDYQELESHYPRLRLMEAGMQVTVLGAGNLISSRVPDDLPPFCRELLAALEGRTLGPQGLSGPHGRVAGQPVS